LSKIPTPYCSMKRLRSVFERRTRGKTGEPFSVPRFWVDHRGKSKNVITIKCPIEPIGEEVNDTLKKSPKYGQKINRQEKGKERFDKLKA